MSGAFWPIACRPYRISRQHCFFGQSLVPNGRVRLSEKLYIGLRDGEALLSELASSGLAVAVGTSRFHYTDDPQLRQLLDADAEAYAGNLLDVTELIHASS